jgi:hypothetical protein
MIEATNQQLNIGFGGDEKNNIQGRRTAVFYKNAQTEIQIHYYYRNILGPYIDIIFLHLSKVENRKMVRVIRLIGG